MWEIAFLPELERRRSENLIDDTFRIYIAQWLIDPDGDRRVLFNEEVKGYGVMRPPRAVQKGEVVYTSDYKFLEEYDLPDELLDCGHFTVVRTSDGWCMFFNFLSGRAKARDLLVLAAQFLDAAEESGRKGHAGPAVDNLFSASELISKAELILYKSQVRRAKSHGLIASEINNWARLGNIDSAFVSLFNKLSNQRPSARYGDRAHAPSVPDQDSFELVRAMIHRGFERVSRSTDRNPETTPSA